MATILEYLQSIVMTAMETQQKVTAGDYEAALDLLSGIHGDLDAAEKQIAEKL